MELYLDFYKLGQISSLLIVAYLIYLFTVSQLLRFYINRMIEDKEDILAEWRNRYVCVKDGDLKNPIYGFVINTDADYIKFSEVIIRGEDFPAGFSEQNIRLRGETWMRHLFIKNVSELSAREFQELKQKIFGGKTTADLKAAEPLENAVLIN